MPAARTHMLGWIGQKPVIFAGTIEENIRFGRPEAGEEEVHDAIRHARLSRLIATLPLGLKTPLGEGGFGLSGGQAQRIAIARAFLKDAPLLLLDEPTAHLDPAVERDVLESIQRLAAGRTVMLASHSALAMEFARNTGARRLDLDALRHARCQGGRMNPVLQILLLWRAQAGWLFLGALLSLGALAAGVALMGASGHYIAASLLGAIAARAAGLADHRRRPRRCCATWSAWSPMRRPSARWPTCASGCSRASPKAPPAASASAARATRWPGWSTMWTRWTGCTCASPCPALGAILLVPILAVLLMA